MKRNTFATLGMVAFGLVFASFVIMGLTRIVLPYRTARLLAAPPMGAAVVLVAILFVQSVLAVTGLKGLE